MPPLKALHESNYLGFVHTGTLQSSPPSTSPSTSQSSSPDDSDSDLAFSVNRSSSASESSLGRLPNVDIMPNATAYMETLTRSQQEGSRGISVGLYGV